MNKVFFSFILKLWVDVMKKLLVIYATYGSGHKSIGLNIKDYYASKGYEVKSIDILSYTMPIVGNLSRNAVNFLMTRVPSVWSLLCLMFNTRLSSSVYKKFAVKLFDNKSLRREILDFNPDLVIATHFDCSTLISKYKKKELLDTKLITIVTDYRALDVWLKDANYTDAIVVSSYDEKMRLLKYGFKSKQIFTSGIPLLPKEICEADVTNLFKKFKLTGKKPIILFFCGGGEGATGNLKYLKALIKERVDADILLIAGRSKKAKEKALEMVKRYQACNVKVFGFVTNVNEFYTVSDFVITKPGGAQVTECLYYRKPMILIKSNGGQEIGNRFFLLKKGYALGFISTIGFVNQVNKLLKQKKVLERMIKNIDKIKQEKSMEKLFELSEKLLK